MFYHAMQTYLICVLSTCKGFLEFYKNAKWCEILHMFYLILNLTCVSHISYVYIHKFFLFKGVKKNFHMLIICRDVLQKSKMNVN